jgi:hypothetical protein
VDVSLVAGTVSGRRWLSRVFIRDLEVDVTWTTIIWRQFGAALDMLENALRACPDELWSARLWSDRSQRPEFSEFWYITYHTLFWLDLYLSGSVEGFTPPLLSHLTRSTQPGCFPKDAIPRTSCGPILSLFLGQQIGSATRWVAQTTNNSSP